MIMEELSLHYYITKSVVFWYVCPVSKADIWGTEKDRRSTTSSLDDSQEFNVFHITNQNPTKKFYFTLGKNYGIRILLYIDLRPDRAVKIGNAPM